MPEVAWPERLPEGRCSHSGGTGFRQAHRLKGHWGGVGRSLAARAEFRRPPDPGRPSTEADRVKLPSSLSSKKPCQDFYTSCKIPDRLNRFGKAPRDVNSMPSEMLPPTGKLVFYAL